MTEHEQLEQAIASLESQRAGLGDEVVDAALAPLKEKLAQLDNRGYRAVSSSTSERRIVTVLFCDVIGSTSMAEQLDPEEWTNIMNTAFDRLIEPVERYGGTVARLMGDSVLAIFGAPVAHEDDPGRAVLAALAMLEGIGLFRKELQREQKLDFSVRVGINIGLAVVGEVGTEVYGEFTAIGDAVNLAARMEKTAKPGTVQIAESTYKMVASRFECEPLGRITVKGKSEPVLAFRVLRSKEKPVRLRGLSAHGISSPLVGRESELAVAKDVIARLSAGEGGILSILGEAGIGKSRLLEEIRQYAPTQRILWLEGRTLSYGQTISYWPFQEILWGFSGITEEDDEAEAWHKLEAGIERLFDEQTIEILPYLGTLLALEVPDAYADRIRLLDGEAMRSQIFLASRSFFERLALDKPLVLAFEDLHWVDESSVLLLEHLLSLTKRAPILICGTSRQDLDSPAARLRQAAKTAGVYTELQLTSLSPEASQQLLQNLAQVENLPPRVNRMIVDKVAGNPFYLEEIIRALIDGGLIVPAQATGLWPATGRIEAITIPDTVHGVIVARLDQLSDDVKWVLRTASVIGRSFVYRLLRVVVEDERFLDGQLSTLQEQEFIREKQQLPELEYIFKHALAQEATYESILLERRRELHGRVGQAYDLGKTHLEIGRRLEASDPDKEKHLKQAIEIFTQLDTTLDLKQAQEILSSQG